MKENRTDLLHKSCENWSSQPMIIVGRVWFDAMLEKNSDELLDYKELCSIRNKNNYVI